MSVNAEWVSPWLLMSATGDIEFQTVKKTALDASGKPIFKKEDNPDKDLEPTIPFLYFKKSIVEAQYQKSFCIRMAQMTLAATNFKSNVGQKQSSFTFQTSASSTGGFASTGKQFMCRHDELQNDDHILGTGMYVQDWIFFDRWTRCPDAWKLHGQVWDEATVKAVKQKAGVIDGGDAADGLAALRKAGFVQFSEAPVSGGEALKLQQVMASRIRRGFYVPKV